MSVIVDASFLVSLTNPLEKHHNACVHIASSMTEEFVIPVTVLPEATYILASRMGHKVMRNFVGELIQMDWSLEGLHGDDLERAYQLLSTYWDAKLDFADATIVAIAERLGVETILTLDRRDFMMVRPKHISAFHILP